MSDLITQLKLLIEEWKEYADYDGINEDNLPQQIVETSSYVYEKCAEDLEYLLSQYPVILAEGEN